jgi:hypothetical protein
MALTDASLVSAARFLLDDLASNGCQAVAVTSVSDFQNAYNSSSGATQIGVDGYYGASAQHALQATIDANQDNVLGSYTAPPGCVGKKAPGGGSTNPPVVVSTASTGTNPLPYIVGAIVIAGALAAYTYSHKKKRRR